MARPRGGRQLLSVWDIPFFKWLVVAMIIFAAVVLLALVVWALCKMCSRKGKTHPAKHDAGKEASKSADVEKAPQAEGVQKSAAPGATVPPATGTASPEGFSKSAAPRAPAWPVDTGLAGIVLSPTTPPSIQPLLSPPRVPPAPPYERLVLISSRVHGYERVAGAVLPGVAYVVYDWKNFTLQELLLNIKKVLSAQRVATVAVLAPGSRPGTVGLLEGGITALDKLATRDELVQFWRALASCCIPPSMPATGIGGNGAQADGRRVDLLGCRVLEGGAADGAALLKDLWERTGVPFAAADDARDGFLLSTFVEHPATRQLGLITANIPALDLYFNRAALMGPGAQVPVSATATAAMLPGQAAGPVTALAPPPVGGPGTAPLPPPAAGPAMVPSPPSAAGPAPALAGMPAAALAVTGGAQQFPAPVPDPAPTSASLEPTAGAPDHAAVAAAGPWAALAPLPGPLGMAPRAPQAQLAPVDPLLGPRTMLEPAPLGMSLPPRSGLPPLAPLPGR